MLDFLKEEGVSPTLIRELSEFRASYDVPEEARRRLSPPRYFYYGPDLWREFDS